MPRFVFTLQALLDQRLHIERQKQLALGTIERQRLDVESRIGDCQAEIRSHKGDLRRLLSPEGEAGAPVELRTVRLQAAASLHAEARTRRLALQLAGLYRRAEDARRELREATTRRRAVEILKQKRYEAWRRAIARKESAEMDEIGTIRAAFKT